MKKIKKHISEYLTKYSQHPEKMDSFASFIETFFMNAPEEHEEMAEEFYEELKEVTEEVDEEMLIAIVDNLKKRDGTHIGGKWTIEETTSLVPQYGVKEKIEAVGKKYCPKKFWFAMNYVYAVHHSANRLVSGYVDLAIDEITNKNICFDDIIKKVFRKI